MPDMVELTDEEVKLLRGSKALMDQLLKSPKTRREAEKLIKTLHPEAVTTDDVAAPYIERIDGLEKKIDKFLEGYQGEKLDGKLAKDFDFLRETRSYTKDGIEKIKQIMVEKQIPDAIVAADHWERQNPPPPPENSNFAPTDWGFGGDHKDNPDLELLFKDEDRWAEKEAKKAWDEETKKNQIRT